MDTARVRIEAVAANARNAASYAEAGDAAMARHFARSAYSTAAEYGLFSIWAEQIARMEKTGHIKRACTYCQEFYTSPRPLDVFAPAHAASQYCRSGHNNHCTCDTCF